MGGSWKVAYADFVTALMAFFLLMWILNMASPETKEVLSEFFSPEYWDETASGGEGSKSGNIVGDTGQAHDADTRIPTDRTYMAIAQKLAEALNAQNVPPESRGVTTEKDGIILHMNADALFRADSTDLLPQGHIVLDDVAAMLAEYNLYLVIRGHAHYQEKGNALFPDKWELSTGRAISCVRYLVESANVKPSLLRAVGYGDIRPLLPGNTPEEAAKNRRVEFFFHRPEFMDTVDY